MSVAVLVDFKLNDGWTFRKKLAEYYPLDCRECVTNTPEYHGSKSGVLKRYLKYFTFPLKMVLNTPAQWECIVGWQLFYGLNYAFWSRLLGKKKRTKLIVLTFIYNPKRGFLGKIYERYIKYSLSGGYIDKVVCFSPDECRDYSKRFGLPDDLFTFIPLGIGSVTGKPVSPVKGDYIFTTGRSNRDYDFLVEAVKDDYDLKIACPGYKPSTPPGSKRVEVLDDCFGDKMLEEMAGSMCVVIPLRDTKVSSGQLVLLQAMRMGKPVIVTENLTMPNYIDNGQTGFIIEKDKDALLNALHQLSGDDALYAAMSESQKTVFRERFTEEALAERVADMIRNL